MLAVLSLNTDYQPADFVALVSQAATADHADIQTSVVQFNMERFTGPELFVAEDA